MVYIKFGLVIIMLFRAVYTDIREGRIENLLLGIGFLLGLICAGMEKKMAGLWLSVKMAAIITIALFFLFVLKGLGAGDIKLLAVLAVFFPKDIVFIVITAFFTGAAISLGRMLLRMIKRLPMYKRGEILNFSVPIAIGTIFVELYGFFM